MTSVSKTQGGVVLADFERSQVAALRGSRELELTFAPGDTVRVGVRIVEGDSERVQNFEGVVIARKKSSGHYHASFVVRKLSDGEGVERTFMLHSPLVEKITIIKRGKVRRSKLYYLRKLTGKAARIEEKSDFTRKK